MLRMYSQSVLVSVEYYLLCYASVRIYIHLLLLCLHIRLKSFSWIHWRGSYIHISTIGFQYISHYSIAIVYIQLFCSYHYT